jgi:hypothetical protein|nr:MAG TPA: hypothetical protein [Caudoviricetes sp.]
MTKSKFYEVSKVMDMVELILKKFHVDMIENNILSSVFCYYEDYFTVLHPLKGHINSNDTFAIVENGEYVLKMLNTTNKYDDMGWAPYLTALKLGIDEINRLLEEDEE